MKRILVVEDEYHIRNNLQQILELSGYAVLSAEDGEQALTIAITERPDLIVSDVQMPKMDGYQFLSALRDHSITQLTPVIFLTARADRPDQRQAMALGADDYITKPFTPEELLEAIEARLTKSAASAQQHQEEFNEFCAQLSRTLPHELNTPLNGMMTSLDILLARYSYFTEAEVIELLKVMQYSSQRLHRLIQNFLLYAELELKSHSQQPPIKLLGFGTNLQHLYSSLETIAKTYKRPADLKVEFPDLGVGVPHSQLTKIVSELLDNAFKFSKPGTAVCLSAHCQGDRVEIVIQDQGRGMTPDQLKQVGAYVQFERKIYEQQGCGLGLTIAQRLAKLFGGDITIATTPQVGTTVTLLLPLSL